MDDIINISRNSPRNDLLDKRKKMAAVAEAIVNSDDDVEDGMDVCKVMENQQCPIACSSALHTLGETIRSTLLEINVIREQNRERRHRELLQILLNMVQQENIKPKGTNSNDYVPPYTQDYTENGCSSKTDCGNNINQNRIDSASLSKDGSSKYTKVMQRDQVNNNPQVNKIKNDVDAKNNDKELRQMRTQMLEIQRKKMEDRERKKREFARTLNV